MPRIKRPSDPDEPGPTAKDRQREPVHNGARSGNVAIETDGLTKQYGSVTAVADLSLRVPQRSVVGFVGPNGAGKTTTIRMLLGLVRPTRGDARVLGESITEPQAYLSRVGALIEAPAFLPGLSGGRNLTALALLGGHDRGRIPELLELVGLAARADDAYRTYSLGMKQRLGLAAALLPDPDLLILDEPTNGLDPAGIQEVRGLLRRLGDAGKTVFVSSHLLAEVQRVCDRLVVIRHGQAVWQGPTRDLLARNVGIVAVPRDASQVPALVDACVRAGHQAEVNGAGVLVHAPAAWSGALCEAAMRRGIVLRELRPQGGDLEDLVLEMTGRGSL